MKITKLSQKGLELIKPNRFYVYEHLKPNTGEVFYIGKGCDKRAFQKRSRNNHWNNIVNKYGLEVNIVYNNLTNSEASQKEIDLIDFYGLNNLCNMTQGGDGCASLKQESKDKISNSLKGRIQSQETKDKRSKTSKLTWQSIELKNLKREQSKKLTKLGIIGFKGKPSHRKGKPYEGNKEAISNTLKEYYKTHSPANKINFTNEEVNKILNLVKFTNVFRASKELRISRNTINRILKENENN